VDQARADLAVAEANLKQAENNAVRSRELFGKSLVSEQERDASNLEFVRAQAQLVKAKASLSSAEERLTDTRIVAPISGTILSKNVELGQIIASGPRMSAVARCWPRSQTCRRCSSRPVSTKWTSERYPWTAGDGDRRRFSGRPLRGTGRADRSPWQDSVQCHDLRRCGARPQPGRQAEGGYERIRRYRDLQSSERPSGAQRGSQGSAERASREVMQAANLTIPSTLRGRQPHKLHLRAGGKAAACVRGFRT